MKVDSGNSHLYANQRTQTQTAKTHDGASFSAALTTATSSTKETDATHAAQTNFTTMTRQELRDWVNEKTRSGDISLDDSFTFFAMTLKIPAGSTDGRELDVASDNQRFDFMQKARDGIKGAVSRNDETTLKMLESALSIMQRQQGRTKDIDISA
ncbi:hypothetical protein [Thiorhodococcus fuscus]|uniref:Uncharacterized protein n=1 Tax=Thiorhodococcus fuscus TaxID=527200 RepID=A0ABW4Y5Q4_9GAMM